MLRLIILASLCAVALAQIFPYNVPKGQEGNTAFLQALQQQALHYINQQHHPNIQIQQARELAVAAHNPATYNAVLHNYNYHTALQQHQLDQQRVLQEQQRVLQEQQALLANQ
ncbi:cuticle protein 16-like [Tachypleus tridentatus]|uniref:cuticle protein 16-like n=1 Tax=Tachypleus tridentatus TaxID=6853 RepID=UPI003FCFC80B